MKKNDRFDEKVSYMATGGVYATWRGILCIPVVDVNNSLFVFQNTYNGAAPMMGKRPMSILKDNFLYSYWISNLSEETPATFKIIEGSIRILDSKEVFDILRRKGWL